MNLASLRVDPIEVGRLAIIQRSPASHVERRVERLDLVDDYHYEATVTQQFTVPHHRSGETEATRLLVPLGQFPKDHLPDLRVLGPDGAALPLLSRKAQGRLVTNLFSAAWRPTFFKRTSVQGKLEAEELWRVIRAAIGVVATAAKTDAHLIIIRLQDQLQELHDDESVDPGLRRFVENILKEDDFWDGLRAHAESRPLVALLDGTPGDTYVVSVRYAEPYGAHGYSRGTVVRKLLAWLGVIGIPTSRVVANDGHAASLWIIQTLPDGLEFVRCFWNKEDGGGDDMDTVLTDTTRAVARGHRDEPQEPDNLLTEVQVAPSSAVVGTIALSALLLIVSTYVYQALPDLQTSAPDERATFLGLGSIFAAAPAAIAGALAFRDQAFARRVIRGPRVLLALLSAQAAFFAVVVSLKDLDGLAEADAYILSIYSLAIFGVFLYIQLGPRWRRSKRSRRPDAAKEATPMECRERQTREAIIWLGLWAITVVIFARAQSVLQHDHFFTPDFPKNVWDAWWSWFGL